MIIRPGISKDEVNHAYDLDPWHPLVIGASRLRERPNARGFSAAIFARSLPNDPKLRQRAAEFLRKQDLVPLLEFNQVHCTLSIYANLANQGEFTRDARTKGQGRGLKLLSRT